MLLPLRAFYAVKTNHPCTHLVIKHGRFSLDAKSLAPYLAVGTLDKYRGRAHKGRQSSGGPMLPVEVVWTTARNANGDSGRDGVLVVESRSGHRIEVRRGFDAGTLERLLTVLDRT